MRDNVEAVSARRDFGYVSDGVPLSRVAARVEDDLGVGNNVEVDVAVDLDEVGEVGSQRVLEIIPRGASVRDVDRVRINRYVGIVVPVFGAGDELRHCGLHRLDGELLLCAGT